MSLINYMESNPFCKICSRSCNNLQPHHYISRGAGGKDEDTNLERLCIGHHQEVHRIGIKRFAIRYGLEKPRELLKARRKWTDHDEADWKRSVENQILP